MRKIALSRRKILVSVIIAMLLVIAFISAFAWIYQATLPKRVFEKNLTATAEYIFAIPNKQVSDLYTLMEGSMTLDELESADVPDYTADITENLAPLFTEKGFEAFKVNWYRIAFFGVRDTLKTQVKSVKFNDFTDGQSEFTATLICTNESEKLDDLVVTGTARSDKEGKIDYWALSNESTHLLAAK